MSDINIGFGKVLRVRWLKKSTKRRHIFVRRDDSPAAMKQRHDEAYLLLEERRRLRVMSQPTDDLERRIKALGYKFQDEPGAPDARFSYWRYR